MADVSIESDDEITKNLARLEVLVTILADLAAVYLRLRAVDDGMTLKTVAWHLRRWRSRLRGCIHVRIPAWPVIIEAEEIVRRASRV